MTLWQLALRGLRYHWRTQAGAFLGAVLATAILTGALAVGDSVRASLRQLAFSRIGKVELALYNPGRFFRTPLAQDLSKELNVSTAAIGLLRGAASTDTGDVRAGRVQVIGVTEDFWKLGTSASLSRFAEDTAVLNERLARFLGVQVGDEVLLRVDKPSLLSRDAPLSKIEDATVTIRVPVGAIIDETSFGNFSLEANQIPPYNVFVSLTTLQKATGTEGRANTLLLGPGADPGAATSALWKYWQLTDAGLKLKAVRNNSELELRTDRVFLEPSVVDAAQNAVPGVKRVLTYFVNALEVGKKSTPYSVVSAIEGTDLKDDEAILNQWLADDLGAKVGDTLTLKFWLVGPLRKLEEHTSTFRVRRILPLSDPLANDPELMPDIPGLTDKKDCRQWEPGVPIDLNKIRDKDQAYWSTYRGTPKAFITLKAGQTIWNNRFGKLTALRYPNTGSVEACVRQSLSPASLGLFFQPVRARALDASTASTNFGGLFIGFSLFLIVAALLLTSLLFAFGVEQRATEVGTLLALGLMPKQVRQLLLLEGGLLALLASIVGAALATLYTRGVIAGLSTVWKDAVVRSTLVYHAEPGTLIGGAVGSFLVALLVIFLVARKQAQAPALALLSGRGAPGVESWTPRRWRSPVAVVLALLALGSVAASGKAHGEEAAGMTFMGGALLLIAGLLACRALLARWERQSGTATLTLDSLGLRNSVRRPSRSIGAIALFACGSFLVVAINAFRHDPNEAAHERASGTGGFALYGEASLPVYVDLNSPEGRDKFALDEKDLAGVSVVPLRLREGDEASCLNLNKIQTPRLVGIDPAALRDRKAFTFTQSLAAKGANPWSLLDWSDGTEVIPVIGDMNTVTFSLQKQLGSTFDYVDDRGGKHTLKIVGVLANSVLQGSLIVAERRFITLFPNHSGYQVFLIDAPKASTATASKALTQGLEDVGFSLTPTPERLATFNAVENTYLSIFGVLGGLGLILGSVGLGVIVLRNVLERRGELALLRAVGLPRTSLQRLVFAEHAALLVLGLLVGVLSALLAVFPALRAPGANVPVGTLAMLLTAVFASGFAWVGLATALALRAPLLNALRNE